MSERRIGVYICYCGGNISDYVEVEKVRDAIENEEGVTVAKTTMFACSDAAQQEMIDDINEYKLDGLVVASCSPTLHLFTFRGVAERAKLNSYLYIQVNLREQCSWAHTNLPEQATEKAIYMVKAGIAKARLTQPLEKTRIDTVSKTLVVGAGISGLRAALALSDLGISAFVIEKTDRIGGWIGGFNRMYPHDRRGNELVAELSEEINNRKNIKIFTEAELVKKSGSVGDFDVKIKVKNEQISLNVGSIIVTTGFTLYQPAEGEYAYGTSGVLTLPEYKELIDSCKGELVYQGKPVKDVTYIYCVGSRDQSGEKAHEYCSRYCCNAAIHASLVSSDLSSELHQFHLFRDIRTYGKYELLYQEARQKGAMFIKFEEEAPPHVEKSNGRFQIQVKDVLTCGEELEIESDLVVLVVAMEPRSNQALNDVLKLPVSLDGFFKEVHPKLRPVETVIDGVFIAGAAQAPRNSAESVTSALAATSKSASLLKKGYVELEPLIAMVNKDACIWCDKCTEACPYSAIEKVSFGEKEVAEINTALCKGCGCCVPVCPKGALYIKGYTDQQVRAMIDAMEASYE
ncbi:MAG: CoB--CoM heterodisulfide reductase iron-sulfur subunit A family protein [candidate division Zixibacteria bacterium]|nr:CoB--CoM heterodisulfide reductase iron-sulfur subunit A family protein [candidate division Zixibacteria bacterium]